jgi:hypothetical protein
VKIGGEKEKGTGVSAAGGGKPTIADARARRRFEAVARLYLKRWTRRELGLKRAGLKER